MPRTDHAIVRSQREIVQLCRARRLPWRAVTFIGISLGGAHDRQGLWIKFPPYGLAPLTIVDTPLQAALLLKRRHRAGWVGGIHAVLERAHGDPLLPALRAVGLTAETLLPDDQLPHRNIDLSPGALRLIALRRALAGQPV